MQKALYQEESVGTCASKKFIFSSQLSKLNSIINTHRHSIIIQYKKIYHVKIWDHKRVIVKPLMGLPPSVRGLVQAKSTKFLPTFSILGNPGGDALARIKIKNLHKISYFIYCIQRLRKF